MAVGRFGEAAAVLDSVLHRVDPQKAERLGPDRHQPAGPAQLIAPGPRHPMIDQDIKRSLGQMVKGVQVVGATHDGVTRAYTSHWVCQVSFEEPVAAWPACRRSTTPIR